MWIFLNDSFLSIVDKAEQPDCLMVRARRPGDIEALFPEAKVVEGVGTDYSFRAEVPRSLVAEAVARRVQQIDYPNFKGSVEDYEREKVYMKIWRAGLGLEKEF